MPAVTVNHSTGLVVAHDDEPGSARQYSFRVSSHGGVDDLTGWGHVGELPPMADLVNVPVDPKHVHSVAVEADNVATRKGLRKLIDGHLERYGECQVYLAAGVKPGIRNWVAVGCPEDGKAPSDEELAETVDVLESTPADEHFVRTSEPVGDETSKADIPDPLEVEKEQAAKARHKPPTPAEHRAAKEKAEREEREKALAKEAAEAEEKAREPTPAVKKVAEAAKARAAEKSSGSSGGAGKGE